jgi:uncharacterized protein YutE (UPF0331/DUF86 family)
MVKPEVIRRRLQKLDEYLSYLKTVQAHPKEKFLNHTETWASAERFLQMAIESVNDIASHIIAAKNLGPIEQYRDIPAIFSTEGHIDKKLEEKWIRMIGFRNILVHGYVEIDRSKVFHILQNSLDDLASLKKVFAKFL